MAMPTVLSFLAMMIASSQAWPKSIEKLKDEWFQAPSGRWYSAYIGIRYAEPPAGHNRFKDPIPVERYEQVRRLVDCLHVDPGTGKTLGEEDCLFLNVYGPPPPYHGAKMPVIIWITGNPFTYGTSQTSVYDPYWFMDHDIVVVTMSYRVGVLGFATVGSHTLPGNFGLKDQQAAINWVLKHIDYFDGDPEQITLAGHGSGASHALFHLYGHFAGSINKGIALSGSRFSPWALTDTGLSIYMTYALASNNCESESVNYCLAKLNGKDIVKDVLRRTKNLTSPWKRFIWPFRPVVDGEYIKSYPSIPTTPNGNFSLLLGMNRGAADIVHRLTTLHGQPTENKMQAMFHTFVHENYRRVFNFYSGFGSAYTRTSERSDWLAQMTLDGWFIFPAMQEARAHSGPTQAFMFHYKGKRDIFGCKSDQGFRNGTKYWDELQFFFRISSCLGKNNHPAVAKDYVNLLVDFVYGRKTNLKTYQENDQLYNFTDALYYPESFKDNDFGLATRLGLWDYLQTTEK